MEETKQEKVNDVEQTKPKRQLTEKQLESLKKGREKKQLLLSQSKEVTADKKQEKKQEKALKEQKLKEEYEKVIAKKQETKQEDATEEAIRNEETEVVPQNTSRVQKQAPAIPKNASRVQWTPKVQKTTDEEIYGNASLELLRKKLRQETRQRLMTDLFNY